MIADQDQELQKIVAETTALLQSYPPRSTCLLCAHSLADSATFQHRGVLFYECGRCHHVQSRNDPDEHYEQTVSKVLGYEGVYPALDMENYKRRCDRIYQPKADWLFDALHESGKNPAKLSWCDIGCGTGSFLYALKQSGCTSLYGIDRDEHNLKIAQDILGDDTVARHTGSFAQALRKKEADIYSAFFVLEHVKEASEAIEALKNLPQGCFFAFSVPTMGLITLFESVLPNHYPRNLDGMMHTQIYTEDSIRYLLDQSNLEPVSEWIFGQDAIDIHRFLSINLKKLYPPSLYERMQEKLIPLIDPLQTAIDRGHFSDARHILAIRR